MADVRFGSEGDICAAKPHVCFAPNSDRESRPPEKVKSALLPEADLCELATLRAKLPLGQLH